MSSSGEVIGEWRIGHELGSGHFAKVKLGEHVKTGKTCAVKIIKKLSGSKATLIKTEVDILKKVNHPYIVKCYDVIDHEETNKLYLFMELMSGGELFDRIVDKGHFTEQDAMVTTIKLIDAINYLHSLGIAHRDLKPENMLMTDSSADAEVKITDFGLSKFFDEQSKVMQTPCGTPGYIAPEVLRMKGYGKECDVWSLGVIIYILLCGFPPFYAENDAQLYEKIKRGEYEFLRPYWDPISDLAKDLIRKMLTVDPHKRITCEEALQHEWLKAQAERVGQEIGTVQELREGSRRKMKAAMQAVEAVGRMTEHSGE
uniref:Protein kinase domain-containing protein n=1 Tax=Calcidiscus leptoporus TaxID=127549 RepID=A0A7S0J9G7_9EUKA|mmetsp:Transcript_44824/g.104712  ORF Transcript_44824/g.104712 Transcript_44824/m.104712 type:complete len:314 (+) Transcript_44824:79-1020(+)